MKIAVGSTSGHKVGAVEEACLRIFDEKIEVKGYKAQSGINEQPVGLNETLLGAKNRLWNVLDLTKGTDVDLYVAMEGGLIEVHTSSIREYLTLAMVVAEDANGNHAMSTSSGIEFPADAVAETERRGFEKHTVGSVLAETGIADATDPHSSLTNKLLSRKDVLAQALLGVVGQLLFRSPSLRKFKLRD